AETKVIAYHQVAQPERVYQKLPHEIFCGQLAQRLVEIEQVHDIDAVAGEKVHLVLKMAQPRRRICAGKKFFWLRFAEHHDSRLTGAARIDKNLIENVLMPKMHAIVFADGGHTTGKRVMCLCGRADYLHVCSCCLKKSCIIRASH